MATHDPLADLAARFAKPHLHVQRAVRPRYTAEKEWECRRCGSLRAERLRHTGNGPWKGLQPEYLPDSDAYLCSSEDAALVREMKTKT